MFGEKSKKIASLESDVKYWATKAAEDRRENIELKAIRYDFIALEKKLEVAESQNLVLSDSLYKAEVQRDTLGQVLKQLHIPVKLK